MTVKRWIVATAALVAVIGGVAMGQEKPVTASGAWVAEPAAGSTSTSAYAVIENPSMYEVFVVKVVTEAAGTAEILREAKVVPELSVPAFGSTELKPDGLRIELKALTKPLKAGDTVLLTLTTDTGTVLKVDALVRKR